MADGIASFFASPYRVWQEGREERALDEQVAEAGLPAVELSEEQARAMGFEDLNALRRARLASGEQWNIEENMQIAQQMGPIGKRYADISRVSYHPEKWPTLADYGAYRDRIRMHGTGNPFPLNTLVHEFTHRAHAWDWGTMNPYRRGSEKAGALEQKLLDSFPENPNIPTGASKVGRSEILTRFLGAWRADTPEEWEKEVSRWHRAYPDIHSSEARRNLEKLLDENRETLLALEAEAEAQAHRRHLAVLEERGLPYTLPTEEEWTQMRTRDLEQRSKAADSRAAARRPNYRATRN